MKTKFLLFAALLITTITFSQTSKKGYDHYTSASAQRMNKAELTDAMAKDANLSKADAKRALEALTSVTTKSFKKGNNVQLIGFETSSISKRTARTGRNPQTGASIKNNGTIEVEGDFVNDELDPTKAQQSRQRPFDEKLEQGNNSAQKNIGNYIRKKPGRTKATDYNSSRSNRDTTNY